MRVDGDVRSEVPLRNPAPPAGAQVGAEVLNPGHLMGRYGSEPSPRFTWLTFAGTRPATTASD